MVDAPKSASTNGSNVSVVFWCEFQTDETAESTGLYTFAGRQISLSRVDPLEAPARVNSPRLSLGYDTENKYEWRCRIPVRLVDR